MDPKATIRDLLEALIDDDFADVRMHAEHLHEWAKRGGFVESAIAADMALAIAELADQVMDADTRTEGGRA